MQWSKLILLTIARLRGKTAQHRPPPSFPQFDSPCPNQPIAKFHTTGLSNVKGCALAIAYKSNASEVVPGDFTVLSVNQTCVWMREMEFEVPERMPACEGGCVSVGGFGYIRRIVGGADFQCNVTNATSTVPLAKPKVPRRCELSQSSQLESGQKRTLSGPPAMSGNYYSL
ncbi:hypothetical protein EV360DRAFT_76597 [Lentinula raphanica]|nr:hypothetical protein EV360DRAFT_76597 [Lentinula raphanica]